MTHIYRELKPIPIPDFCLVNRGNGRVFISTRTPDNRRGQLVLGRAVKDPVTGELTLMYPNDTFRLRYAAEWTQAYGVPRLPHELHIGLYGAALAVGRRTGLYDIVLEALGPKSGNAVMDYAMFLMRSRSNTTELFAETMRTQALFSERPYEDSWFSELFGKISGEQIHQLRTGWLTRCAATGTERVWLCIDGSNNDCTVADSTLAAKGAAKSHKNVKIVSYIWAVDADSGLPVTWFVNHGGMVDAKAIKRMVKVLQDAGLAVEGVILDRGFCAQEVMTLIEECSYSWIIMLKESVFGFKEMYRRHASDIRCRVERIVDQKFLFGIADKVKIFKESKREDCVALFYDHVNGAARAEHLSLKILTEKARLTEKIRKPPKKGREKLGVSPELRPYLSIAEVNGVKEVVVNEANWQEALEAKGFYAIASSAELSAEEIDERYDRRDASEKQFMILKNQLGFHTTRVHSDQSIESKFAAAFVAAVIRSQMISCCKQLKLDVNKMILGADHCRIFRDSANGFNFTNDMPKSTEDFLAGFGLSQSHFEAIAQDFSRRLSENHLESMTRTLPPLDEPESQKESEEETAAEAAAGSDAQEEAAAESVSSADDAGGESAAAPKPRRKGRPKGAKNKKTIEREKAAEEERRKAEALGLKLEEPVKRGRGRPKGVKNKSTLEREAAARKEAAEAKKRSVGRPKGAWSQTRIDREVVRLVEAAKREAAKSQAQEEGSRKPGRPKGRKNDKTLEKEAREMVMAMMRAEQKKLQNGSTE